jgi:transposase
MIKIEIPESDLQMLKELRYNHPHPRVMLKADVVFLKGLDFSNIDIAKITGVCENTMREYWKQYNEGGIERLKEVNFYKPKSELNNYSGTIEQYFTENPPASISQASAIIKELTGIERGETQTRKYLKSLKFKFIKAGSIPAKALTEEKKTNKENFWIKS